MTRCTMPAMSAAEPRHRVLLADDDDAVRRVYARVLEHAGYDVDTASDGREALSWIKTVSYDTIVSDIDMPGLTGVQLLRAVRECDLDVPVILVTGAPAIDTATRAVEYGAFRYLLKPVDAPVLAEAVKRAVRMKALAEVKREALALLGAEGRDLGDRAALEARFDRALAAAWMAFQPIVSWSEKRAVAYEALLRTDEKTLQNPLDFLAAAERLGRLHDLGRMVRARVAEAAQGQDAPADVELFVNVHTRDLEDEELARPLAHLAERVVMEITERASLDGVKDLPRRVLALREAGFRVAIDDLGAGYAGLTSFTLLEPDIVKIDMSLVRNVDSRPTQRRVIGSMVRLCDDLGMRVICEGVETPGERDALLATGCDLFQGYLFARPGRGFPEPKF